jgi:hypothetical protein
VEFIKKYKIQHFEQYQRVFLKYIEQERKDKPCIWRDDEDAVDNVYSDWLQIADARYWDLVLQIIAEPMQNYMKQGGTDYYEMLTCWWTQYDEGGTFDWHTHEGCNLVAVLQLQINDPSDSTKIWGYNEVLKEGELVIYPASAAHTGSPAKGKKTIIGMNFNVMIGNGTSGYRKGLK